MSSWPDVQSEIKQSGGPHDFVRRKYLKELFEYTGRNVIIYYSGWLEKQALIGQGLVGIEINDSDKTGFMSTIHNLDRSIGLDLLLHTPGGDIAACESIVEYLRTMFDDIRVIVPQLAMSCGTMIALSAREIVMGKQSSLGPIDPQIYGMPAHGIIEEFERARIEINADPSCIPLWQPIIAKYSPTMIGNAQKAIDWSKQIVTDWLKTGMFKDLPEGDKESRASKIVEELGSHSITLAHNRHISFGAAKKLGINVTPLEDDQKFQDLILTIHHASNQTLTETPAIKIIENQEGVAVINFFTGHRQP